MTTQKILYVINHPDWFWSHRLPLARGARKSGYDVLVAMRGASGDQKLKAEGFTGMDLPPSPLSIIFSLRRMIKNQKPDIVHAITLKYVFLTGLACFGLSVHRVYTIAGLGYLFSGEGAKPKMLRLLIAPFLKSILKSSRARVIFQNPDDLQIMVHRSFVRAENCRLIRGSGVDLAQYNPGNNAEADPPLILMPTRLVRDKGVAVFIEAARILKSRGVKARFQIAGGIDAHNPNAFSESEIRALISDGAAEWLGRVSDMAALYAGASLIVYPSYYREGIPKVLLEACAMGKAIITTDHPGCREAAAHNENGLLVPVKNAAATTEAIEILLNDPDLRRRMGAKSRERAEREFDVQIIVRETLAVYKTAQ